MSGYKLILSAIFLVVIFGVIFPFFASLFVDVESVPTHTFIDSIVDIIDDGITLDVIPIDGWGEFDINPFSWLGSNFQEYISNSIVYLALLPIVILFPLLTLISLMIVLGFVSIIRGN